MQRQRSKPHTFEDRIDAERQRHQDQLAALPPGPERDAVEHKISQLDVASRMNDWLRSPGQKPAE